MNTQIIPVFPLPIVQFPGALTTLHIFEAKYKKMLNDILDSDKIFGIHYTSSGDNEPLMSIVGGAGCIVEVAVVQGMPDGRSNILCIGQKRYRILSIIDDDPYITADVELFEDEPTFDDLTHLTSNSKKHFHRVLAASRKLNDELDQGSSEGELPELPDDPQTLSFIVTAYRHRRKTKATRNDKYGRATQNR